MAALVAVGALTACSGSSSSEEPGPPVLPSPSEPQAIMLMAGRDTSPVVSRDWESLQTRYTDFAICAWKNFATGDPQRVIMHDDSTPYLTQWNATTSKWIYELTTPDGYEQYLKFWDLTASSYHFVGYAPYVTTGTRPTIDPTTGVLTIDGVVGNQPSSLATDWAVTDFTRVMLTPSTGTDAQDYDTYYGPVGTAPTVGSQLNDCYNTPLPLRFHGLMSGIEVRVFLAYEGELTLTSASTTIDGSTIATAANYTTAGWDYTSHASVIRDIPSMDLTVTGTTRETSSLVFRLLEIPQDIAGKQITFTLTSSTGTTYTGTFTLEDGWEAEKQYIYYLKITLNNSYIFMDVDIATHDWIQDEDIDINDPVTNW